MTSINLVLRRSSRGREYRGSLCLRLIHNRRVKCVTLPGCRLFAGEWDGRLQKIVYPAGDFRRTRELERMELLIDREVEVVRGLVSRLQGRGIYTVDDVVGLYRGRRDCGMLLGFTEVLADALERENCRRTARAYRTAVRGLIGYNGGMDIPLKHISPALVRGFEKYLREGGRLPNTVAFYMRNLRAIYNKAVASGSVVVRRDERPFAGISTAVARTMKRALSLEELQALHALDFERLPAAGGMSKRQIALCRSLLRCWRYFFFCVFARGMSWVDMAYLRKENIRGEVMRYCRRKTGQLIEVRLTHELSAIIDAFADEVEDSPYVFPIIRDEGKSAALQYESALRTQNNRLRRLAELAGIDRRVSTHVARHSWASVGKEEDLSTHVISESLGHASQETTLIYLALLNNRVLDEANERVAMAIKRSSGGRGRPED